MDLSLLGFGLFNYSPFLVVKNVKYEIYIRRAIVAVNFIFFLIFAEPIIEVIIIEIY